MTVYGENEARLADLQLMFDKMCEHTFTLITSQEDFQVHPDIAADFFGMAMRYMRYCSKVIFGSTQIEGLIQFAIVGIGIEHREAAKALCLFFSQLFECFSQENFAEGSVAQVRGERASLTDTKKMVKQFFLNKGEEIVERFMQFLVSVPPSAVSRCVVDVLVDIYKSYPSHGVHWFSRAAKNVSV